MDVVTRNFETAYRDSETPCDSRACECCTAPIIEWVAAHTPDVRFNLMFQYRPTHQAGEYPEINRYLSSEEVELAEKLVCGIQGRKGYEDNCDYWELLMKNSGGNGY